MTSSGHCLRAWRAPSLQAMATFSRGEGQGSRARVGRQAESHHAKGGVREDDVTTISVIADAGELMNIVGPETYKIKYTPKSYTVAITNHYPEFKGIASSKMPKIYIASANNKPFYVGITKQPLANRLRYGWQASGKSGYYGYAWRHNGDEADLDVWGHIDARDRNERDVETIEAEIVYLIRSAGQWPAFQTEIHFYPSSGEHRTIAKQIASKFEL